MKTIRISLDGTLPECIEELMKQDIKVLGCDQNPDGLSWSFDVSLSDEQIEKMLGEKNDI
jgi:hypothetical protein